MLTQPVTIKHKVTVERVEFETLFSFSANRSPVSRHSTNGWAAPPRVYNQ